MSRAHDLIDPGGDEPPPGRRLIQVGLGLALFTILLGLFLPMRYVQGSTIVRCGAPATSTATDGACPVARDARMADVVRYAGVFVAVSGVVLASRRLERRPDLAGAVRGLAGVALALTTPVMLLAMTESYRWR